MTRGITIIALSLFTVLAQSRTSCGTKLLKEKMGYYILRSDSSRVFITPSYEGAAPNLVAFSPDSSQLAYTRTCGYGFEAEGRAVYICRSDGTGRTFLFRQPWQMWHLFWSRMFDHDMLIFDNISSMVDEGENFRVYDLVNRQNIFKTRGYIQDSKDYCFQLGSEPWGRSEQARNICLDSLISVDKFEPKDGFTYVEENRVLNRFANSDTLLLAAEDLKVSPGGSQLQRLEIVDAFLSPDRKLLCLVANIGQNLIALYDRTKHQLVFEDYSGFATQRDFTWSGNSKKLGFVLELGTGLDYGFPDTNMVVAVNLSTNARITQKFRGNHTILDLSWSSNSDTLFYEFKPDWSTPSETKFIFVGD